MICSVELPGGSNFPPSYPVNPPRLVEKIRKTHHPDGLYTAGWAPSRGPVRYGNLPGKPLGVDRLARCKNEPLGGTTTKYPDVTAPRTLVTKRRLVSYAAV